MIGVEEALQLVKNNSTPFGIESVAIDQAVGRVLAEDIILDRDLPPFDRVCMDGIAINYNMYNEGQRLFELEHTTAAGEEQYTLKDPQKCVEVMTGGIRPLNTDTVIRYEDLKKSGQSFHIEAEVQREKNIHNKGRDLARGEIVLKKDNTLKAIDINILATVGKSWVDVKRHPKIAVISSGNELVGIEENPKPYQIRMSNVHMLKARLSEFGIDAKTFHLNDDFDQIKTSIRELSEKFDVLIISGAVSKGKYDYIPEVLKELSFVKLFHGVMQRPGKPFWFGRNTSTTVFAFPGNPVSSLLCFHKYFIPWFNEGLGLQTKILRVKLANEVSFKPDLMYFAQAKLSFDKEGVFATIVKGNGSGDIMSPSKMDGFVELVRGKNVYQKGEVYEFLPFYPIFK